MAEVVGLFGSEVPIPGDVANVNVVELCEELLEKARAGQIVGLVGIEVYRDLACAAVSAGEMVYSRVIGQVEVLKYDLLKRDAGDA